MLLIISANQKDNIVTSKALQDAKQELILTGAELVESSTGVLSDLVNMLDDEDKTPEIEPIKQEVSKDKMEVAEQVDELISDEATISLVETDKVNPVKSFFAKFKKSKKEQWVNNNHEAKWEEEIKWQEETMDDKMEKKPKADMVVVKKTSSSSKIPAIKKTFKNMSYNNVGTFKDIPTYNGKFSVNQKPLPGVNLKTAIGNTYKLWVNGLKLNNAYFNKSLGVINKWDVVKQLTHENKYGCFKVNVISGDVAGKDWYVCKKWFTKNTNNVHIQNNVITTKIGDIHTVSPKQLKLNNKTFDTTLTVMNAWDKLEQIGNENKHGCFQVRMLTGTANDIGRVWYVCKKYLGSDSSVAQASSSTALHSYAMSRSTKVWDTHTISAHSLKLNNAYFTKNLWYLSYGDSVEQLSVENTRGCFQVKVITSMVSSSTGKIGYVCKKYLK